MVGWAPGGAVRADSVEVRDADAPAARPLATFTAEQLRTMRFTIGTEGMPDGFLWPPARERTYILPRPQQNPSPGGAPCAALPDVEKVG
jgi:hypothetical protein